jgi:DNA-binding transcriptional MerR regulator
MRQAFIGTLAKQSGLPIKTIRYYEEFGLLPRAPRTASGYRLYAPESADRLQFIKKAQNLGLRLEEIKEILELADRGHCPCGHVQQVLKAKLTELAQKISDLNAIRSGIRTALRRSRRYPVRPTGKALCPTITGRTQDKKPKEA